jgi:uncharacterized protein YbcI
MEKTHPAEGGNPLTQHDWTEGVETERGRSINLEISNAMVGLKKQFYGKGPTKAKTYINDNYVFCILEGGLTRNEETLIAAGRVDIVRDYRLSFQQAIRAEMCGAVERVTGQRVLDYHSQIVFDPPRSFEIFVLDAPLPIAAPH